MNDFQYAANQALQEYKERLKISVNRATCDLKTDVQMLAYARNILPEDLIKLVMVLNGELKQLKVLKQK
jgi:hypothetical protein